MTITQQMAKHFRDVHFGGNWTSVNLKDVLADVDWQMATTPINGLNTIAVLVFHVNYYVDAVLKVLLGEPLQASDKYSFDLPLITSEEDWQRLVNKTLVQAESFAGLVERLEEEKLSEDFIDGKYGTWYRNLTGIVEHNHYHLGQIVIIKKMIKDA